MHHRCEDKALLVPSVAAITAAGAPADANPIGQQVRHHFFRHRNWLKNTGRNDSIQIIEVLSLAQVPLFACMEIMQERESDDKPVR